jgi:RNA polymerase sigma factor (sigma-70 family)
MMFAESDVLAAAAGSGDAYARVVDGCRGLVASVALAIVRDVPASEEVAQDVFVRAFRSLPRLRNPRSFLPWLRQLTRNRAHKFIAERSRRPFSEEAMTAVADPRPGADERLLRAEELRVLAEALEALPDDAREVLVLYYREGRSLAQAAGLLGLSEDAVKKRLSRARARLRQDVEARFADAAERTRPGAQFTAAVMLALPKAGTGLAAGVALKAAGAVAKPLSAVLPGLLGGLFGIGFGLRKNLAVARDARERRGLWAASAFMAAVVTAFSLLVVQVRDSSHPKMALVALTVGLLLGIDIPCIVWIPRVIARRLEAEMAEDPVGTLERIRRQRRATIFGVTLGTALAWVPVVWFLLQ